MPKAAPGQSHTSGAQALWGSGRAAGSLKPLFSLHIRRGGSLVLGFALSVAGQGSQMCSTRCLYTCRRPVLSAGRCSACLPHHESVCFPTPPPAHNPFCSSSWSRGAALPRNRQRYSKATVPSPPTAARAPHRHVRVTGISAAAQGCCAVPGQERQRGCSLRLLKLKLTAPQPRQPLTCEHGCGGRVQSKLGALKPRALQRSRGLTFEGGTA